MGEPSSAGALAGGRGRRTVAEERERQDQLMARIEDERLVPGWCWRPMTDTLGKLTELPDELAWAATAYLSAVVVRGAAMFGSGTGQQLTMHPSSEVRATLLCRCGEQAPADQPTLVRHQEVVTATCTACGITVVQYDGQPFDRPTLVSQGRAVH